MHTAPRVGWLLALVAIVLGLPNTAQAQTTRSNSTLSTAPTPPPLELRVEALRYTLDQTLILPYTTHDHVAKRAPLEAPFNAYGRHALLHSSLWSVGWGLMWGAVGLSGWDQAHVHPTLGWSAVAVASVGGVGGVVIGDDTGWGRLIGSASMGISAAMLGIATKRRALAILGVSFGLSRLGSGVAQLQNPSWSAERHKRIWRQLHPTRTAPWTEAEVAGLERDLESAHWRSLHAWSTAPLAVGAGLNLAFAALEDDPNARDWAFGLGLVQGAFALLFVWAHTQPSLSDVYQRNLREMGAEITLQHDRVSALWRF